MAIHTTKYERVKVTPLPKSQVEITGTVPTAFFESFRIKALKNINDEVTIDGFRKGNAPEKVLIAKVGEMPILEEMAELALSAVYPTIITAEKIEAIGRPQISITKLALGNPLEFRIVTAIIPEVNIGDYKKIAKEQSENKVETPTVTDADVDEAINRIRRSHAEHNHTHDESHTKMTKEEHDKLIDASLPEVNDTFAQSVGDFKTVAELKAKLREALLEDKKVQAKEKGRIALSEKLSEATTVDIPDVLIQSEVRRIEAQFKDDVSRMGVSFDDYLKHAKKSLEDIRKEWLPYAEKKAKLQLIMNKIGAIEKLYPDPKEVETEVGHILDHYKDADREQATVYAETVLMNEKVFAFLEEQK